VSASYRDGGSVVVGWLGKVVAALVLFAVVAFDGISVGVAHVSGADDANNAALAAAGTWRDSHNIQEALLSAQGAVTSGNETVLSTGFSVDPTGTVHLLLQKTATTLVMYRIGPLKKYTVVTIKGESGPPA
jgi:hypothetical protein